MPAHRSRCRPARCFTLIELLVVVAIIGVLAAMLLPALQTARTKAMLSSCQSQQKQLVVATVQYADDYDRMIPLNDPNGGWAGMNATSSYKQTTYVDASGTTRTADGQPGWHCYRGTGSLYYARYIPRELQLCPDFWNTLSTESTSILYNNTVNWARFPLKVPANNDAGGWSYGTYALYGWSYRVGIGGNSFRLMDEEPARSTGLIQCRQGILDATGKAPIGAHKGLWLNCGYLDGHVATIDGVQKQQSFIYATSPGGMKQGNDSPQSGAGWWSTFIKDK